MKHTTLVFTCWLQLQATLQAAAWPVHPTTGLLPGVAFGGDVDNDDEMIVTPGRSQDPSAPQEWATMGRPGKTETFALDVMVWSQVPGRSPEDAVMRVRALVAVVEASLRDQTTGLPTGMGELTPADGLMAWSVSDIVPAVGPLSSGEGFGASCRIVVDFLTRL